MILTSKYRTRPIKVQSWCIHLPTGEETFYAYALVLSENGPIYHSLTYQGADCKQRAEQACQEWIDTHF